MFSLSLNFPKFAAAGAIIALIVSGSPAWAVSPGPGCPPQFRAIPQVSKNTEANSEQRQSTEQRSQSREANEQVNVPELQLVDE